MVTVAPAATSAGTLSAAGEALHRLPPADARPWICLEPIRLMASTTPGQAFFSAACSPISAPETAAPIRKTPAFSSMVIISAIFLMSTTMVPGFTKPARIWTRRSVPPARIRPAPLAATMAATASSIVFGAL